MEREIERIKCRHRGGKGTSRQVKIIIKRIWIRQSPRRYRQPGKPLPHSRWYNRVLREIQMLRARVISRSDVMTYSGNDTYLDAQLSTSHRHYVS